MEKPVDKALIRKFIGDNCTPEEVDRIRIFLSQPGSDEIFEEILNEDWNDRAADDPVDETQMQRWQDKFNAKAAKADHGTKKIFKFPIYIRYAAVWTILALAAGSFGWYHYMQRQAPTAAIAMLESRTTAGKLLKLQLPDSTIVYLNSKSSLRYPERFAGKTRTVILEGEAFFDVKHDKAHPFMVTADKLNIQVLGTSFNVRSYQDDEDIAVTVTTGKVGVTIPSLKNSETNFLFPNDELSYSKSSRQVNLRTVDAADSKAWESGAFVFNYETLETIMVRLSRWYDVDFVCDDPKLLRKRYKLKLKNENLKDVMETLSYSGSGFKYQFKGKQVIIRKDTET